MKATLREQIREIGERVFDRALVESVEIPLLVERLAIRAFQDGWDRDSRDSRAVLHAMRLLARPGAPWILPEESAVP